MVAARNLKSPLVWLPLWRPGTTAEAEFEAELTTSIRKHGRGAAPAEFAEAIRLNVDALHADKISFEGFSRVQRVCWDGATARGKAFVDQVRQLVLGEGGEPRLEVVMLALDVLRGAPGFDFDLKPEEPEPPKKAERHVESIFAVCPHIAMLCWLWISEFDGKGRPSPMPKIDQGASALFTSSGRMVGANVHRAGKGRTVGCCENDGHSLGCAAKPSGADSPADLAIAEVRRLAKAFVHHAPTWFIDVPRLWRDAKPESQYLAGVVAGQKLLGQRATNAAVLRAVQEAGLADTLVATCHPDRGHPVVLDLAHRAGSKGGLGGWHYCVDAACLGEPGAEPTKYEFLATSPDARLSGRASLPGKGGKPVDIVPLADALGAELKARVDRDAKLRADTARMVRVGRTRAFRKLKVLHDRASRLEDERCEMVHVLDATTSREIRSIAKAKLKPLEARLKKLAKDLAQALAGYDPGIVYDDTLTCRLPAKSRALAVAEVFDFARALASDSGLLPAAPAP